MSARLSRVTSTLLAPVLIAGSLALAPTVGAQNLDAYLGLPLTNRLANVEPGGVNQALPSDVATLQRLVDEARASGRPSTEYAALLLQYRLAQSTEEAGIDLASWDPFAGFTPNRQNMLKSYRYYEDSQLARRELQWAGMGGQVGGDFGGGIADIEWATQIYGTPGLQDAARNVINAVEAAAGPSAVAQLPGGLRVLAERAGDITTDDLYWFIAQVVIMQKAIYSDLMPMHYVYSREGIAGLEEMYRAGLFPTEIMTAWYDVASGDRDRIAHGNMVLLKREQQWVVGEHWDRVRAYKDGLGEAFTFMMTLAGSPSVAGVPPLRDHLAVTIPTTLPDGRAATLHTPIPGWDWSVFDQRWDYVTTELLPRYRHMVENDWPALEATLRVPYEQQFESARATRRIPELLGDVARATYVSVP
jgi:hypothetical protein